MEESVSLAKESHTRIEMSVCVFAASCSRNSQSEKAEPIESKQQILPLSVPLSDVTFIAALLFQWLNRMKILPLKYH